LRRWLSDNFPKFNEAFTAVCLARREQMFAGIDAKFGKAVYELRRPFAECRDVLDDAENVELDDLTDAEMDEAFVEAYDWLGADARLGAAFPKDAPQLLGRVLLGQSHCRVEAMGAERMARLRREFEQLLGNRVKFTAERLDDLAVDFRARQPAFDRTLVPPRLLEEPQQVTLATARVPAPEFPSGATRAEMEAEICAAQDRAWLDEPIPALDGRTPRAAARDAGLRPRLVALMKSRVRACDERNLEQGTDLDVNWMLRELGLDEILFDPPPFRLRPAHVFDDENGDLADEAEDDWTDAPRRLPVRPNLPPAPPLPARPLTQAEIGGRLKALLAEFDLAADALDEMDECGCTLLDEVAAATEGLLKPEQVDLLVPWLIQVWFLVVPPGTRGPALEVRSLQRAIEVQLGTLTRLLQNNRGEREFKAFMQSGPQPDLSAFMVAQMCETTSATPKKIRPQPEAQAIMAAVLRAVIVELDAALRAR
jgi:hypothetical protein